MQPPKAVLQQLVNADKGGPRHAISAPRDVKQVSTTIFIFKLHTKINNVKH